MSDQHSYVDALKAEIDRHEAGWVAEMYEAVIAENDRRRAENDRRRAENDRLREALEHIAAGDFAELATENDRLREALQAIVDIEWPNDARTIARAALAKEAGQS